MTRRRAPTDTATKPAWTIVLLVVALLATPLLASVSATHHAVGARVAVGNPDPGPSDEPDVPPGLTPVYHADAGADLLALRGDQPRSSPLDQSGAGLGEWIGFLDAVLEQSGQASSTCLAVIQGICNRPDDPLYRADPADGDPRCETIEQRLDPEECTGDGHTFFVDVWPGVRVQPHRSDPVGGEASGFLYPGSYSLYVYLFGEGSSVLAPGQGSFSHLESELCEQATGLETCQLITPEDLRSHASKSSALGSPQQAGICFYAPALHPLSQITTTSGCPINGDVSLFLGETGSSLYIDNQPGWYARPALIEPTGSLQPSEARSTLDGVREDMARVIHTYVNPVTPHPSNWCLAPPIATTADDEIATGPTDSFIVEGHDLDVYLAVAPDAQEPVETVASQAEALVSQLTDLLPPELEQAVDELEDASGDLSGATQASLERFGPFQPASAEPNTPDPREDTLRLIAEQDAQRCDPALGLSPDGVSRTAYNLVDARIAQRAAVGVVTFAEVHIPTPQASSELGISASGPEQLPGEEPLKDPTLLDDTGLPARSSQTEGGAWYPSSWTFEGDLNVFLDTDENGAFAGCPANGQAPSPEAPDICAAQLIWDAYNPRACLDPSCLVTLGDAAQDRGYTDPLGLVATVRTLGPTMVQHQHSLETWVLGDDDPASEVCIVGTSEGLLAPGTLQYERMLALNGLPSTATDDDLLAAACPEADDALLVRDAFGTQGRLGEFGALFTWTQLSAEPAATTDQGVGELVLQAVITTARVTDDTASNLRLGAEGTTTTLAETWGNGDRTYIWADVDPFVSSQSS